MSNLHSNLQKHIQSKQECICTTHYSNNNNTLSSHNNGRCNKISKGSASAAMTMNSDIPLFNVLVAVTNKGLN